jgi:very-short-patch-repair endonuclease
MTPQQIALFEALKKRGIKCETEVTDGFKCIDISIEPAKIDIEVDGTQHYLKHKQILADFKRSYYSSRDGYNTIHIPNIIIEKYLNQVADALAESAKEKEHTYIIKHKHENN